MTKRRQGGYIFYLGMNHNFRCSISIRKEVKGKEELAFYLF